MSEHKWMIMKMDLMEQWLPEMKRVVEGIGAGLALAAAVVCEENIEVEKNRFKSPALVAILRPLFPRRQRSATVQDEKP